MTVSNVSNVSIIDLQIINQTVIPIPDESTTNESTPIPSTLPQFHRDISNGRDGSR